ncbi:hypothetical protein GALMADRAFT_106085 [Galerina marginata CBS 339.88]|uniref:Major facilitator superfamily (MFS) profile domain-containing protein n=1 Tax=Galerina marginata (strain CBS 339.88) TaxID=685588 RepID=A0A067SGR8_GALM3|nr:hypothetical protein GALMADRAFT_106085 [Galerina marginata CBS 339.88]
MLSSSTETPSGLDKHSKEIVEVENTVKKRSLKFWLVIFACLMVDLLSALDLTIVSTALPTIVKDLRGSDFIWVGSAYAIASTAILPTIGGLASTLGRKPILLFFISLFAAGSAICGSAHSITMVIAGRVIQGLGGGGCIATTEIIYADLVPLPERGKFLGICASVWAFACAIGPPVGGSLAQVGAWRWIFYLNIPLCGIAFFLVLFFLDVRTPQEGFSNMLKKMDWWGLFIIIASTTAVNVALVWAGVRFVWISAHVLVPLLLGMAGLIVFFFIELRYIKYPTVPRFIVTNRTTLAGYFGTCIHGIVSMASIYYLPVYFQACKLATPIHSGLNFLGMSLVIPIAGIFTGVSVEILHRYRPQNYIGWLLIVVGLGLMSLLDENSSAAKYIGLQILLATGLGTIFIGPQFPILAPLPFSNNAHALAFFTFLRCFSQGWGIVVGGSILQNTLKNRLPPTFIETFSGNPQLVFDIILEIHTLSPDLQEKVRGVFAEGLRIMWYTLTGISVLGLLSCLSIQEIEMKKSLDEQWGLQEETIPSGDHLNSCPNEEKEEIRTKGMGPDVGSVQLEA